MSKQTETPVEITRLGLWLHIRPWMPWMSDVCTCTVKNSAVNYRWLSDEDKKALATTRKELFVLGTKDTAAALHGLWPLLEEKLKAKNIPYSYRDSNQKPDIDKLDYNRLEGVRFRDKQDLIISAVLSSWSGIIKGPPAVGKSYIIELLCKLYCGNLKVLVTSTRLTVVKELFDRIKARCPEANVRRCDGSHSFREDADICVCSAQSLDKVPGEWPGIVLFDEVHAAPAPSIFLGLVSFNCRVFGFSATPRGRSDGATKIITAMFGPEIVEVTYSEAVKAESVVPIEVRMVRVSGPQIMHQNPAMLNQIGIWRNVTRNLRIRDVARELQKLGHKKILIMAETVEHIYLLKKYLPEFKAIHTPVAPDRLAELIKKCVMTDRDDPSPNIDKIKGEFKSGVSPFVLSSFVLKEGIDVKDLDALIRADGQTGQISCVQIGGRTSRLFEGKTHGIVVDFLDDFGPKLYGRSINRVKQYQKEGWAVYEWQLPKVNNGTIAVPAGTGTVSS